MFPSPLGVSYFQNVVEVNIDGEFRQLAFPSPLGVSYFQKQLIVTLQQLTVSFRPLSGYLISKKEI